MDPEQLIKSYLDAYLRPLSLPKALSRTITQLYHPVYSPVVNLRRVGKKYFQLIPPTATKAGILSVDQAF